MSTFPYISVGSGDVWWLYCEIWAYPIRRWILRHTYTSWWTHPPHETGTTGTKWVYLSSWRLVRLTRWGSEHVCSPRTQGRDLICRYLISMDDISWHEQCPYRSILLYCSWLCPCQWSRSWSWREDITLLCVIWWIPRALIWSWIPSSLESPPDTLWGTTPSWKKRSPKKNPLRKIEDFLIFIYVSGWLYS